MSKLPENEILRVGNDIIDRRFFSTVPKAGQPDIYEVRSVTLSDENINNFLVLDFLDFSGADLSGFFSDNINNKIVEYRSEYVKGDQKYVIERNGTPISFEKINLEKAVKEFQMNIFGERLWDLDVPLYRKIVRRIEKYVFAVPQYVDGLPLRDENGDQVVKKEVRSREAVDIYNGDQFFVPLVPGVPFLTRSQYDRYIELISSKENGGDDIYDQKAKAVKYFSSFLNGLTEGKANDYGYLRRSNLLGNDLVENEIVSGSIRNKDIQFTEKVYNYIEIFEEGETEASDLETVVTEVPSIFRIPDAEYRTNWLRRKYNKESSEYKVLVKPVSGEKTASSIFYGKDIPQNAKLGINFRSTPLLFHRVKTPGSREKDNRSASLFIQPKDLIENVLDEVVVSGLNSEFIEGEITNVKTLIPATNEKDLKNSVSFKEDFAIFGNAEFIEKEKQENSYARRRINNINFI